MNLQYAMKDFFDEIWKFYAFKEEMSVSFSSE